VSVSARPPAHSSRAGRFAMRTRPSGASTIRP
jgi:hypothetical protein